MNCFSVFLKKADKYLQTETDPNTRLNLRLFRAELLTFIEGFPFKGFYFPVRFQLYKLFCLACLIATSVFLRSLHLPFTR